MTSQVQDYALRGEAFEKLNFLEFTVETYEVKKNNEREDDEIRTSRSGRRRNPRADYLTNHPKVNSHIRIQRTENHNYLPNIVGQWFPRRDRLEEEDFYYAAILALLRPWRELQELKGENRSWKEEGLSFLQRASEKDLDIVAGLQYYYDCKMKGQSHYEDSNDDENGVEDIETSMINEIDDEDNTFQQRVLFSNSVHDHNS
jgi:hypothetical protein